MSAGAGRAGKVAKKKGMWRGKTVLIRGADSAFGRALALRMARSGCNVAALHDLDESMKNFRRELAEAGGAGLTIGVDGSRVARVQQAVRRCARWFGRLDAVVNATTAYEKGDALREYDVLMHANARLTFATISAAAPYLEESCIRQVLTISPPVTQSYAKWLARHGPFAVSQLAATACTLAFADRLNCNTLWPERFVRSPSADRMEQALGVAASSKALPPDHLVEAAYRLLSSGSSAGSFLDKDIAPVPRTGVLNVFVD